MVVLVPVRGRYTGGRQGNKRVGSTKVGLALCKVDDDNSKHRGKRCRRERAVRREEAKLVLMAYSTRVSVAVLFGALFLVQKTGQVLPCPVSYFCV
jgi:hypothetical protein